MAKTGEDSMEKEISAFMKKVSARNPGEIGISIRSMINGN